MARRRRMSGKLRAVQVVRNKEILDAVSLGVAGNVVTSIDVASAVNDYTGTVGTAPLGSAIKGFEIQLSDVQNSGSQIRRDWFLVKNPGSQLAAIPTPGATGGSTARKFIVHEEKGLANNDGISGAIRQKLHINVPKRYWRMGEGDKWQLEYGTSGAAGDTYDLCVKVIYKWVM